MLPGQHLSNYDGTDSLVAPLHMQVCTLAGLILSLVFSQQRQVLMFSHQLLLCQRHSEVSEQCFQHQSLLQLLIH